MRIRSLLCALALTGCSGGLQSMAWSVDCSKDTPESLYERWIDESPNYCDAELHEQDIDAYDMCAEWYRVRYRYEWAKKTFKERCEPSNVLPVSSGDDGADGRRRHAELSSQSDPFLSRRSSAPNFTDTILLEDGITVAFPLGAAVSALSDHVSTVVGLGSKEEVLWVDTRRIVAAVADAHPIGDRSKVNLPGEAVSRPFATGTIAKIPVALHVDWPSPDPTPFGLDDIFPEPGLKRLADSSPATLGAEPSVPFSYFAWANGESRTASLACAADGHLWIDNHLHPMINRAKCERAT